MCTQTGGGEDRHQSTENHDGFQKISQEHSCAFPCKAKRSEPIQADYGTNDEDDPIGVGIACDVKWRLHENTTRYLDFFFLT